MHDTQSDNPFAPPQSDEAPQSVDEDFDAVYRDGKLLVVPHGHRLPPRCVYCNQLAVSEKRLAPVWFGLRAIKRVDVRWNLCPDHRKRQAWSTVVVQLIIPAMFAVAVLSEFLSVAVLLVGLLVSIGLGRFLLSTTNSPITIASVDRQAVRLKGAGRAFLDGLPDYAAPR